MHRVDHNNIASGGGPCNFVQNWGHNIFIIGHIKSKSSASGHIRLRASPKHDGINNAIAVPVDTGNLELVVRTSHKSSNLVRQVCIRNSLAAV